MGNYYSPDQMALIDRDNRQMALGGLPMSGELESIREQISSSGTVGVTAAAGDIDSIALGGGEFTPDYNTSPAGGTLNFSWKASRFHNGKAIVIVPGGTLALAASTVNYVEVSRAGAVSVNQTGFTSGRLPLWQITTGPSSWTLANVVSQKCHLVLIGSNGVDGSMLSTAAGTKELNSQLGAIAATASFYMIAPNIAATLAGAHFVNSTAVATSDTDNWSFAITNLGAAGEGATAMLAAAPANTTRATGGAALAAGVQTSLTLNGTPANLSTNPNDVLQVTITKTGAPAALAAAMIRLDFSFAG
jgi:hypothetical protein